MSQELSAGSSFAIVPVQEDGQEYPPLEVVPDITSDMIDTPPAGNTLQVTPVPPELVNPHGHLVSDEMRAAIHYEMQAAVRDVEFRLSQLRDEQARMEGGGFGRVYVEDMFDGVHRPTGYLVTNNSPSAGSIAWSSLHIVFMGVDYTIANGNTANKYVWFIKPASGTTATLQTGATQPVLGPNDALIFVNNGGVAVSALETSIPAAVGPGSVTQSALASDVASLLSTLRSDITNAQATADGAIVTYFQDDPPWAAGTTQDAAKVGDVWYDSNDGGAFRWSGSAGSPANAWVRIPDTDSSALTALVNTKITTYVNTVAPTAPSGGFAVGDLWIDTSGGTTNTVTKRWSGSAWVTYQIGDNAISGIGGAKVGTGINASNVTGGSLSPARLGSGISGTLLATNTVGNGPIGPGAVQPTNMNTSYHMLY